MGGREKQQKISLHVNVNIQIVPDNKLLFSKVKDVTTSNNGTNDDITKITQCTCQQKRLFNPDVNKQATKVCFSQLHKKSLHPPMIF